jgi:hypothetical protein
MQVDTMEVDMTEHDDIDDDNDEVKIIKETKSYTEPQKTDDELIINARV